MGPARLRHPAPPPGGTGGLLALLMAPTIAGVVLLALLIGGQIEDKLRQDAHDSAKQSGRLFTSLMFDADEFENGRLNVEDTVVDLRQAVERRNVVLAVRLYQSPARVIFSSKPGLDRDPEAVEEVRRAFAGETTSELTTFAQERARSEDGTAPRGAQVLEVNLPVRAPGADRPTLVATVFLPYTQTRQAIADQIHQTRLLIGGVALLLLAVIIPLFLRGARSLVGGRRHVRFQRELNRALEHDEIVLHYQPKVALDTGAVVGSEALVRWHHPEHGLLSPDRFVPRAEETGLIYDLTMRVFDLALAQVASWRKDGIDLPPVAVNLSPMTLGDPKLASKLAALLERHAVSAQDVVIEMTETSMAEGATGSHGVLAGLHQLGFQLSIDDFGTGYSSLARLDQLPLIEMKIDRSFVARIAEGGRTRLVSTMIDLAHDLGMRVVGEGVESQAVADVLAESGCDIAQGYHYARPMPAADAAAWLTSAGCRFPPARA